MKILPLLLLLGGCATTSLDDLYAQRTTCLAQGVECPDEIHEKIDRKERQIEQRAYDRSNRCPGNLIEYCDDKMYGCGRMHKSKNDKFYCITPQQAREALGVFF